MTITADLEAYDAHLKQHGSSVLGLLQQVASQLGGLPPMPLEQESKEPPRDPARDPARDTSAGGLHLSHADSVTGSSSGTTKRG